MKTSISFSVENLNKIIEFLKVLEFDIEHHQHFPNLSDEEFLKVKGLYKEMICQMTVNIKSD